MNDFDEGIKKMQEKYHELYPLDAILSVAKSDGRQKLRVTEFFVAYRQMLALEEIVRKNEIRE